MSTDENNVAIKVEGVSKTFKLPHEKRSSVKGAFVNLFRKQTYEKQRVLKDISFEVKKGEFFGIVGRNGSGKSTLLKLLAGIYTPSKGQITINGVLTPFIELGVGFNPELTGRENVFLNGALLGFNRKEMLDMYDEIVEFAELERFMDQKLKNYSSGMQVRLAFAIAIQVKSGIFLLDEVLAVGDENFQRKCYEYFSRIKKQERTVVFVSHDMDAVRDYCTRAVLIHNGQIVEQGATGKVVAKYSELNFQKMETDLNKSKIVPTDDLKRWGNGHAKIDQVWTSNNDKKTSVFKPRERIEVKITITSIQKIENPVVGMILQDMQGRTIFATNTKELKTKVPDLAKNMTKTFKFSIDNIFTNGTYTVSCAVASFDRSEVYSRIEEACQLVLSGWTMPHSMTHPENSVMISDS